MVQKKIAASASQRTVEVSHGGQQSVRETIEGMSRIKERVEGIAENILALSEQTQQIGEIIATVNEIAAQSNMLALNASIEAARAGEYGKGFAVVAMEVRTLAEQSRQATDQVKTILSEIQKATNATVMATEEGTKGVDEGVQLAAQAQAAINQMYQVISESAQAATQVLAGSRQQVAGVEQVAMAVNKQTVELTPALFTACYGVLDAIQDVEKAFESGATTPPSHATQAVAALDPFRSPKQSAPEPLLVPSAIPERREIAEPEMPVVAAPASVDNPPVVEEALAPRAERGAERNTGVETIRIDAAKLDALMAQLSELHITRIRAEQRLVQVQSAQAAMSDWQKEWLAVRETYGRMNRRTVRHTADDHLGRDTTRLLSYLTASQERLRDMVALINNMGREYSNDTMQLSLAVDALEDEIKRARMLPLSTITAAFGRMVRDLAHSAGKEATLTITGGDVELDKRVLEQIKDPLIHLLRNAIDHGLETPDTRADRGKPRAGTITLKAEQVEKNVVITVTDDGKGLDHEAIRRVLARRNPAEAQTLNEDELTEAIFALGISTSPIVTDVSGRGVGLDVVRRNVEELHGRIQVASNNGDGATFTLTLPLALTSSRALVVQVSNQTYAIPLNAIERILEVTPRDIYHVGGHEMLRYNESAFSVAHLSDVRGLPLQNVDNLRGPARQAWRISATCAACPAWKWIARLACRENV